ncbi:MAG: HEPN domain-containing protein [Chitinophagaceae bacterium]|nr:HEPN domain-containing protein [Chitinophagaceae bacterium]
MQSFRTELENPVVEKDIIELERKIYEFKHGKIPEEKFRSLRLARGVYGQRQQGVQMIRIKIPYGKMSFRQWLRICEVSDTYSNGNLHLTTRQDIQLHFVSLDHTPKLWAELEKERITLREACGNTVRNITASDTSGIDPEEAFDVSPYAQAMFEFFLRKPVCQEMGRKFKIAFSNSDKDTALTFMHDLGAIAKVKLIDGKPVRGFKVVVGGGLGAQPHHAICVHEFLPAEKLIPFTEGVLRVFDRYGERNSRHKARIKFLIHKLGKEAFLRLVEEEQNALTHQEYSVPVEDTEKIILPEYRLPQVKLPSADDAHYNLWLQTNVFAQKQNGFYAAYIRVPNGNISTAQSRKLIASLQHLAADDIRVTINQGLQLRFILKEHLPYVYAILKQEGLHHAGFGSLADVTSCPGTDTCNLGISNSTNVALAIAELIEEEYPEFLADKEFQIKISGCMNSCGQHAIASIGFHGSSMKVNGMVMPALQVLIGGANKGNGEGVFSNKVIKIPSRRALDAVRILLNDYKQNKNANESFSKYAERQGEKYFYELLKELANTHQYTEDEFIDWGAKEKFSTAIGVGECAGVIVDLVATLFLEAEEKIQASVECLQAQAWADAIYHAYSSQIHAAKALLLQAGVSCNTHDGIIRDFDKNFTETGIFKYHTSFRDAVLEMNRQTPGKEFAEQYLSQARLFLENVKSIRSYLLTKENDNK